MRQETDQRHRRRRSSGYLGFISNTAMSFGLCHLQLGGGVLDSTQRQSRLCDPESLEAIQFMVDLIHKDRVSAPLEQASSFVSGRVGMHRHMYSDRISA